MWSLETNFKAGLRDKGQLGLNLFFFFRANPDLLVVSPI